VARGKREDFHGPIKSRSALGAMFDPDDRLTLKGWGGRVVGRSFADKKHFHKLQPSSLRRAWWPADASAVLTERGDYTKGERWERGLGGREIARGRVQASLMRPDAGGAPLQGSGDTPAAGLENV